MPFPILSVFLFATFASTAFAQSGNDDIFNDASSIRPRVPLPKSTEIRQPTHDHRLTVKFVDSAQARVDDTTSLPISLTGTDLASIRTLAARHGARFAPLIDLPTTKLQFLEERAMVRSGQVQPDLAAMMVIDAPGHALPALASALLASKLTEWVHYQEVLPDPPCTDIAPTTPSYFLDPQDYHGPDPGLNILSAWAKDPAALGGGIRIADCEYWYVDGHEDLCDVINEPGQTPNPAIFENGWHEHGGATLGEMVSLDNGYGCTGLVPEATPLFFPEWTVEGGSRRATAIANAIASVEPGDIVLLEMQTFGGGGYCPAEFDPAVWTVVKNGSDAGVIVVGAAGNGNRDLDSADFADYMDRGDSGAILVGAGSASTSHNKLSFSTFGSRVNIQGWGESVFTLGYGYYARHGNDDNQTYTATFSGTSSASPFIASCAASLQGLAKSHMGRPLTPLELRDILVSTGIPQGSGGHIGPFPDMGAASTALLDLPPAMGLRLSELTGGELGSATAAGADPGAEVHFVYSLAGPGETYVPPLDVVLGLASPILAGSAIADRGGLARYEQRIPIAGTGRPIWVQAAQEGLVSTIVSLEIQ